MYKKNSSGWFKHYDFILLDLLCIQLAFYISYVLRQGDWNPYVVPLYLNMAIFVELADIIVMFIFEAYKNVLRRGYYKEFASSVKQSVMLVLVSSLYLLTIQEENGFSRVVLFTMAVIYGILTYITRLLWKRYLKHRMKTGGDCSLIIVATSGIAEKVIKNVKEHNYEMWQINGIIIMDKAMSGKNIAGIPVVADAGSAEEFLLQNWVDEVFINLEDNVPYPDDLIERCSVMGITTHLNLAKVTNHSVGKQSVCKVGEYTVLTTCINVMTTKQAFMKRTIDILAGLAGCLATGIIFLFVAPVISYQLPGTDLFFPGARGTERKTV